MQISFQHEPVLLRSYLERMGWEASSAPDIADLTVGGAGHLSALLRANSPAGRVFALDQDQDALDAARKKLEPWPHLAFIHANFRKAREVIDGPLDRITVDLGVSSYQLDRAERGFSFQKEGPLDMRMDGSNGEPVWRWLARCSKDELAGVLWELGEEKRSRWFASKWMEIRKQASIQTTTEFVGAFGYNLNSKDRQGRHPMTRVFQALRMHINDEMGALQDLLSSLPALLKKKGRVAIFTFHSLEDRCVKWSLRGVLRQLDKKVIVADEEEAERNPRSRSAKLRVFERE